MPWRADHEGKGSGATGSGRTRHRHESCPDTRSGTPPTGGVHLAVTAGEKREGALWAGPGMRWAGGGFWAAGKKREGERVDGELGRIKGNWAGPKERKEREVYIYIYISTKDSNNSIQI